MKKNLTSLEGISVDADLILWLSLVGLVLFFLMELVNPEDK